MQIEKLQSFVLSTLDYGDSDRIVTLFTLEHGRIKAFARGARNSRKRFGAALEPFARIDAQLRIKEGLSALQQCDILSIYPTIRGDLPKIANALYACEIIDSLTPEGQPLPRLFRLLAAYLEHLETNQPNASDRRFLEINLLNILGYRPSLSSCSRCGASLGEGALLQRGGETVCRSCTSQGSYLAATTLKRLSDCLSTGRFGTISFTNEGLDQAGRVMDEAISGHAGRTIKSLEFLRLAET